MGAGEIGRERACADDEQTPRVGAARWRAASAEAAAVRQSVSRVPSIVASVSPVTPDCRI